MTVLMQAVLLAACIAPWVQDQPPSATHLTLAAVSQAHDVVLQLTLENRSSVEVRAFMVIPSMDYDLDVRDAKGALVQPMGDREMQVLPHHAIYLEPGATFVESAPLRAWGYALSPGSYRVTAYLRANERRAVRSNTVRVVVGS